MALTDDSQLQSLAQVDKIDADALLDAERVGDWVDEACGDLGQPRGERNPTFMLPYRRYSGLTAWACPRWRSYSVCCPRGSRDGRRALSALGRALTLLGLPRHDALFDDIPAGKLGWSSQWRQRYERHWGRQSYLAKRDAAQLPFSGSGFREKLTELRAELRDEVVAALEAYVEAPDGVSDKSAALFHHDWSELERFSRKHRRVRAASLVRKPSLSTASAPSS